MFLIIFMFYKQIHRQAFSLVELLITITVLGILASISFVSLQGYVINSRDALRITDLKNISNALSTFEITHEEYPLPSNNFKIDLQGNTLNYQGVIDSTVLQKINVTN
jgi:prepilin-type N-terminal cleavage/methylation domain-containing protein